MRRTRSLSLSLKRWTPPDDLTRNRKQTSFRKAPKRNEFSSATFPVYPAVHTVDEEDQDAFLHRVICIRDVAFHLKRELLVLAANFDQLPDNMAHSRQVMSSRNNREHQSIVSFSSL